MLRSLSEHKEPRAQLAAVGRFYKPILQASYDDHPRRQHDLEHLATIAKRYRNSEELLADVALDPIDTALTEAVARGQGYVTLSTVHSAKGLEWKALFIIWVMDGWFPSLRAYDAFEDLDEERRLLYVATTRAKQHLYFVHPQFTHSLNDYEGVDHSSFSTVSRFLEPIPPQVLTRAMLSGE
jgi:DNA helicase-2/ATP-dependent DNA helicase PcrA